jgi:four helix bundle protein
MSFGHEQLDVYRAALEYVAWAYRFCGQLKGHRNAKDQLLRASQAIPLNIAEGNGKATDGDRRRYFEIARGSALECSAIQDVLEVCGALTAEENARVKVLLDRIVAMLTRLGRRDYAIREQPAGYAERESIPIPTPTPRRAAESRACRGTSESEVPSTGRAAERRPG